MSKIGRFALLLACALALLALAACNGSGNSSSKSAVNNGGANSQVGNYGPGAGAGTGAGPVKLGRAQINGKLQPVLTNAQGRTLYYSSDESAQNITCTGACQETWPPVLTTAPQIQSPPGLPGTLTTIKGPNGLQVVYNGHPLYTYSGDTGPDQTTGNLLDNKWHVATPDMPRVS